MYIFIQSMLRQHVGGVFDGGSCGLMVDPLQRGCWSPNDVFGSLQHCSGVTAPHGDAAGQDGLNHAAVEAPQSAP